MSVTKFDKSEIRVIGFDLDQTLYPKSPEIDEAIQEYIYSQISLHKNCSLDQAKKLFKDLYQDGKGLTGSQSLQALGIPRPKEIVQEALEKADITKFLLPDPQTHALLTKIRSKFKALDLITGSTRSIADKKLQRIGVNHDSFNHIISGEIAKSDGSAFKLWLESYPDLEARHFLYIGDREKTDHFIPKEFGIQTILVNIKNPNPEVECAQLSTLHELEGYLI